MNICLVLVFVIITAQGQLQLKDNGYEGLYIVIDENVNENAAIIERLKTIFTEASETLFKATNSRAYFRNIAIVIPKSWKVKPEYDLVSDLSSLTYEHIIVQYPCDGSEMRQPFVRQYGTCGHRGLDMILDPLTLLLNETEYGRWDKVIVHMWAHLRWGVFDENIVSPSMTRLKNLHFDFDKGEWKPVKCTDKIQGGNYIDCDQTKPCKIVQDSVPEENCRFCPLPDQESAASLMFSSNILSVDAFCDEDHNKDAHSFHNSMCSGRSVWNVIKNHSDFAQAANPPIPVSKRRPPTFRLLQRRSKVRVFLLDRSGSMSGLRIEHLYRSAKYIIENLLQDNSYLAIITFSSTANITAGAIRITNDSDRQYLLDGLPLTVDGMTSIGAGLAKVLQHLRDLVLPLENAEVFLISDGEENTAPFIDDVIDDVKQSKLIVHTIAVSQNADIQLKNLAQGTGGRSLTYLETPSITFLDVFSQAVISGHVLPDSSVPVIVYSYSLKVDGSGKAKGNFKLDTGIGFDTKITVMASTSTDLHLNVSGPSVSLYKKVFIFDTVPIPEKGKVAPAGEYFFTIAADRVTDVNIYVSSFPIQSATGVVRVTTWFSSTTIDFKAQDDIILFVSIDQCRVPVINATVLARMDVEGNETIITLRDNGAGPDLKKDDGIYSGYILKKYIFSNGRYNMKVFIEGISDTSPEVKTRINKRSTHHNNSTTLFTRVSIPDEIVVINYTSNQGDITPPDRIKNFRVIQVVGKNKYLLTWTATGDDRDQGQAQRYDIRNSDNIDTIRYNFSAALPVENITLSPLPSGEEELIALHGITDDEKQGETSFLAIRAIDESGNEGDVSNIISLVRARSFNVIENNITEVLISPVKESIPFPSNGREETYNTAIMLSSIVAGICVLLAVIVSILLVKTFKKKAKVGHGFPADSMNKLGPSKMYFNRDRILEEQKTPPEAWHIEFLPPPYRK